MGKKTINTAKYLSLDIMELWSLVIIFFYFLYQ